MVDDAVFTALDVQNGTDGSRRCLGRSCQKRRYESGHFGYWKLIHTGFGGEFKDFKITRLSRIQFLPQQGIKAVELTANMAVSNGINAIEWDNGLDLIRKASTIVSKDLNPGPV